MKLRKKKTGAIVECEGIVFTHCNALALDWEQYSPNVNSLAELNEEWEDYQPQEPLIKDEKIRKAVRAWAGANNIRAVYYSPDEQGFYVKNFDDEIVAAIYFGDTPMEEYEYDWNYTIAELCGEEEE